MDLFLNVAIIISASILSLIIFFLILSKVFTLNVNIKIDNIEEDKGVNIEENKQVDNESIKTNFKVGETVGFRTGRYGNGIIDYVGVVTDGFRNEVVYKTEGVKRFYSDGDLVKIQFYNSDETPKGMKHIEFHVIKEKL